MIPTETPTLVRDGYVDLGGGWYCTIDVDDSTSDGCDPWAYVADANHPEPDVGYGPAAWNRRAGPASGRVILRVKGAEIGTAGGAGEGAPVADDETFFEDCFDAGYARHPFPGRVQVTQHGRSLGLGGLDGGRFADLGALAAAIRAARSMDASGRVPTVDEATRLERTRAILPEAWSR